MGRRIDADRRAGIAQHWHEEGHLPAMGRQIHSRAGCKQEAVIGRQAVVVQALGRPWHVFHLPPDAGGTGMAGGAPLRSL